MLCSYCYAIGHSLLIYKGNGRGGIRTHGGFPHARFRVECLKPDSATLPQERRKTANVQRSTSNVECNLSSRLYVQRSALDVERLHPLNPAAPPSNAARFQASECMNPQSATDEAKKCYNFKLARADRSTASCISTRTATLLLVVDCYSQVLGAAVYEYAQLIR